MQIKRVIAGLLVSIALTGAALALGTAAHADKVCGPGYEEMQLCQEN
jgi:hypothetical protein